MSKQVYWSVLPERAILEESFRAYMNIAVRSGELGWHFIDIPRMRTDTARDSIVARFKLLAKEPDDTLLMFDIDHTPIPALAEQLVADDKDVVMALAFRSDPFNPSPCFWQEDANGILVNPRTWEKGLIRADVVGMGAIAIKRSVFTRLEQAQYDKMYFFYQYPESGLRVSDEAGFSQMCRAVGIELWVDTTLVTPHHADAEIDESTWERWCADNPVPEPKEHKVSVIIPQKGRLEQFKKCLDSIKQTVDVVECIVVTDGGDEESASVCKEATNYKIFPLVVKDGMTPVEKWNEGAQVATGDILVLAANDVEFEAGWLENALDALRTLPDEMGVIGLNDSVTNGQITANHFLVTKDFLAKHYGGTFLCPEYKGAFVDSEICAVAREKGLYRWAQAARIIHHHPLTDDAPADDVHREGVGKYYLEDSQTFEKRRMTGFPVTWKSIFDV